MADQKEMSGVMVLKKFFGILDGQNNTTFVNEVKALDSDEKEWLIKEAAKELGVKVKVK